MQCTQHVLLLAVTVPFFPLRFVWGGPPGASSAFSVSEADWAFMEGCGNLVVASAIFGEAEV